MTGLVPYLKFAHRAREALSSYRDVFGGELDLHTYSDFGRSDGPPDAIAHGMLHGLVSLAGADATADEAALHLRGISFSLLGTADPATLEGWFAELSKGGTDIDPLQGRPWGAHDGEVTDRFGVRWLIGYEE
ncbi:VOC family protein [Microbacterium sp. P05]|uniref:VOC family protein n=1 Tax=Microbacterium sp. P05 TaxID=3366948 RepID=UPI003746AC17